MKILRACALRTVILVMSLVVSFACFAQSPDNKPAEPTVIGDVFLLDSASQTLKPLPEERWEDVPKKTGFFAHEGLFVQMSGDSSSYRIKSGTNLEFVFKIGKPESVALYAFSVKKNKRLAEYAELLGGRRPVPGLPAEITQFGQSSFKLVPKSALAPGEYVIRTDSKMFTFGIDE